MSNEAGCWKILDSSSDPAFDVLWPDEAAHLTQIAT
jgi:hypothetical protein